MDLILFVTELFFSDVIHEIWFQVSPVAPSFCPLEIYWIHDLFHIVKKINTCRKEARFWKAVRLKESLSHSQRTQGWLTWGTEHEE